MGQLAEQELLARLQDLALGDVAGAFKHESAAVHGFQIELRFYGQHASVLGTMLDLTAPAAGSQQLLPQLRKRRARHDRANQLLFLLSDRFLARISVQLLTAAIPHLDPAVESPDKDRTARKLDQPLLLHQLELARPQRLLDNSMLAHVDERNDHAVDLVVDRAIGPHANVVPAPIAATNLALHNTKIDEHGMRIPGQVVMFKLVRKIGDRPALVGRRDAEQL